MDIIPAPGGSGDVSSAVILAPTTSARNVIQSSTASVVPLTVKGAASQTADLLKITDSADAMQVEVSASGRVAIGAAIDSVTSAYGAGARLQIYDDGLSALDDAVIEVFAPQSRGVLHLYNTNDNNSGFYPWFFALSEYVSSTSIGQDFMTFWYGMHTPTTKPAIGAFGFSREGGTNGVYMGVRSNSTTDAEFAFIADLFSSSYPLKIYPATKAWVMSATTADTALLSAGEFTWNYDDDDVSPTITITAKTADGTGASATIPLTPS